MSTLSCERTTPVSFEQWPHDSFYALLLPSGKGEVYRTGSSIPIGEIERKWGNWTANGVDMPNGYLAIEHVVRQMIDSGKLILTKGGV